MLLTVSASVGLPGPARPAGAQDVADLQINSTRYIVVDAETGEVYAERNKDERAAIGSLTKIFTVIEAMEIAPLDTMITTDESDLKDPANNSLMGFDAGEVLSLEELLYGMMLPSGNDAAHAVARSLGYREGDTDPEQSVDRYMGWINQRLLDMGLTDTHLITPDGWGVPGHYTTVHDLAAFTRYAMEYPFFKTLISTPSHVTAEGNTIYNNNRLLGMYDDLVGGKTGYDWDAGWCLVEVAEKDGMQMISVTLDGVHEEMDWYDDNEVLLEYGFDQKNAAADRSTAWDGNVALFADPDVAFLDRNATAAARIGGQPVAAIDPAASVTPSGAADVAVTGIGDAPAETTGDGAGISAVGPVATGDGSGGSTAATVAWAALVVGLVALAVLAGLYLSTRARPRRTLAAGGVSLAGRAPRRSGPAGGTTRSPGGTGRSASAASRRRDQTPRSDR